MSRFLPLFLAFSWVAKMLNLYSSIADAVAKQKLNDLAIPPKGWGTKIKRFRVPGRQGESPEGSYIKPPPPQDDDDWQQYNVNTGDDLSREEIIQHAMQQYGDYNKGYQY